MENNAPASDGPTKLSSPVRQIPVTLLTGFLGSGKTTLLRKLLTFPTWSDTAVLVNELGAAGLDHNLVWGASGTTLLLENGCICCSVRDDLVASLEDLFWKRLHRQIPRFSRVVIETTGLADPRPIINELFSHRLVSERYCLESVLCTVDAVFGERQLEMHPESLAQAGSADVILLTKTDLSQETVSCALEAKLRQVNPLAVIQRTVAGDITPEFLQSAISPSGSADRFEASLRTAMKPSGQKNTSKAAAIGPALEQTGYLFHHRIHAAVIRFNRPWRLDDFNRALQAAVNLHGDRILRIKGMISVADESCPVVVQAVQKMVFPFETMPSWPGGGVHNFIVCITLGLEAGVLNEYFRSHTGPPAVDDLN
ncbi:MAG: GTP-binding protein [Herminiimonas sp.]|nr:GTP-binding protein [Herminiimonas sp.]